MSHNHESSQDRPGGLVRGRVRDPFWSAVQRRHPEVDIILLPPEQPPSEEDGDER